MKVDALLPKLETAQLAISKAEDNLEKAIGNLHAAPRTEKVGISTSLEAAFSELRSAKAELTRIEALIAEDLAKG
jgi:hypothetical protein